MSDELLSVDVLDRGPDIVVKLAEDAGGSLCLARLRPQLESTIKLTMLHRILVIRDDVPDPG